ncbi:hypothetical protein ACIRU3_45085 [Streptomyces sp. NPDC101151]|uniref:hypothetical protein n=1 Tax=Streptomyces sp. NPDC101151 TaxID=3366115 RepID=UPI0038091128
MGIAARLRPRRTRAGSTLVVVAAAAVLTGCADSGARGTTAHAAPFTAGGVSVTVRVVESSDDRLRLLAELRPEQAGFHLYSLGLPDDGVDGIGIPTRVRVDGGLRATGPAATDAKPRVLRPAGLDISLPVYEDGKVTLELPVRHVEGEDSARVFLTYGACSESAGCLAPVRDRAVTLPLVSAGQKRRA